jgi:hypothetical protein
MATVTLVVTQAHLNHVRAGGVNQEQIAVREASADIRPQLRQLDARNRVRLVLGGCVTLVAGDTGAIWRSHNAENAEDFDSLYGLLARRPGVGMQFLCEVSG